MLLGLAYFAQVFVYLLFLTSIIYAVEPCSILLCSLLCCLLYTTYHMLASSRLGVQQYAVLESNASTIVCPMCRADMDGETFGDAAQDDAGDLPDFFAKGTSGDQEFSR